MRQSGGIVDAITNKRHSALLLQDFQGDYLAFRHHFGHHFVYVQLARNRIGSVLVVARNHHHFQTHRMQGLDGGWRGLFNRVGHGHDGGQFFVYRRVHRRFALRSQTLGIGLKHAHVQTQAVHVAVCAHVHFVLSRVCRNAQTGQRLEIGQCWQNNALGFGSGHNGSGYWMLGAVFSRRNQWQYLRTLKTLGGDEIG